MSDLVERVAVLRDEVLDIAGVGASDACAEIFEAVLAALTLGTDSIAGIDVTVQDVVARRLAWGDPEAQLLADAEWLFDRLLIAAERAFRDYDDQMVVVEAATQVAVMVSRALARHAVERAARDRASRLREEMAQRQLQDAVDKQAQRLAARERELAARGDGDGRWPGHDSGGFLRVTQPGAPGDDDGDGVRGR